MREAGISTIVSFNKYNVYYMTGFKPIEGVAAILSSNNQQYLIVPRLEYSRALEESKATVIGYSKYKVDVEPGERIVFKDLLETIFKVLREEGFASEDVGVEYSRVSYKTLKKIIEFLGEDKVKDCSEIFVRARSIKSPSEIGFIEKATRITEEGLKAALDAISPGIREIDVAARIEYEMKIKGCRTLAFESIVASGVNAALPHATVSEKRISRGEVVIVDIGARYMEYCSDLTRTFIAGKPSSKLRDIYHAVLEAQNAAINAVKPGVKAKEVDEIARNVLREYGYGHLFIHSIGHGVGLEVHEYPGLNSENEKPLEKGMVVTIEPGVYVKGYGGVRIEDIVVVEETGPRVISRFEKSIL